MPLATLIPYCTRTDVEHIISVYGVDTRLDDDNDGSVSPDEEEGLTDCISEASDTINFYCFDIYDPTMIATSNLAARWTAMYATYLLCRRRANPVPESLFDELERVEEKLERIHDSKYKLPGVPLRRRMAPTWSNLRADARYHFKAIRVERNTSSQQQTGLPQQIDFQESFTYEI